MDLVLLDVLLNGKLNNNIFKKFIDSYVITIKNELDRKFTRTCKCPFK